MSKIKILAVEDDPIYAEIIRLTVEQAGYEILDLYENGEEALQAIESLKPDLLLLDVRVHGQYSGIEIAEKLNHKVPTIFITSLRDRDIFEQAKKTLPLAFILKPFDTQMLSNTIELAVANMAGEKKEIWRDQDIKLKDSFFIKEKNSLIKVRIQDILYIKAEDKYCILHTDLRKFTIRIPLKELLAKTPDNFIQIHRSYIIDYSRIDSISLDDFMVYIEGAPIPIGVSYKDNLLSYLDKL